MLSLINYGSFASAASGRRSEQKELPNGQNLSAPQADNKFWEPLVDRHSLRLFAARECRERRPDAPL